MDGKAGSELDKLLATLHVAAPAQSVPVREVLSQDGTRRFDPSLTANQPKTQESFEQYSSRVDSLFGDKPSYQAVKHEKPEHRLMLWLSLQGHNAIEIARITGYTPEHVRTIRKQPWFRESFCRLSTETGRDVIEAFLEGEVIPTCQALIELRDKAESEAVRKAACDSILDRVRGKPTVKLETKHSGSIDHFVTDVEKLMEEQRRNEEILRSRGIGSNN